VNFYLERASRVRGAVLEIGCGTGRLLLPIAARSIPIYGIDASRAMLEVCKQKLSLASKGTCDSVLGLKLADMRTFRVEHAFQMVIVPFRTFQFLLTVEDQLACLANLNKHLHAGGLLVLDLFDFDLNSPPRLNVDQAAEPAFMLPDKTTCHRVKQTLSWNHEDQTLETQSTFHLKTPQGGQKLVSQQHRVRYTFRFELEHLLARSGFSLKEIFSDFNEHKIGQVRPGQLVVVAEKQ
jgi:SAM-dependent methyltransferase